MLVYQDLLLCIAKKHVYVINRASEELEIQCSLTLKSNAKFAFLVNSKLYVGGTKIDVFSLDKNPYPRISTIQLTLDPMPSKIHVIDNFSFFTGEALFKLGSFTLLSLIHLGTALNDFCLSSLE